MGSFILTWKSKEWHYSNIRDLLDKYAANGSVECLWRISAHKKVRKYDRAFLLKQLPEPRGIFAAGTILDIPKLRIDPSFPAKLRWRSWISWDLMVDPADEQFIIPLSKLRTILGENHINARASGQSLLLPAEQEALSLEVVNSPFVKQHRAKFTGPAGPTTGPLPISWIGIVQRSAEEPAFTYALQFGNRNVWKVGHTVDLGERIDQINKHIPYEVIGEKWEVRFQQRWNTSLLAHEMEQTVFQLASAARTVGERLFCSNTDIEAAWQSAFRKLKFSNEASRKGA